MKTCKHCGMDQNASAYRSAMVIDTALSKPIPWYRKVKMPVMKMPSKKIASSMRGGVSFLTGLISVVLIITAIIEAPFWIGFVGDKLLKAHFTSRPDYYIGTWFIGLAIIILVPAIVFIILPGIKEFGDRIIKWPK